MRRYDVDPLTEKFGPRDGGMYVRASDVIHELETLRYANRQLSDALALQLDQSKNVIELISNKLDQL